MTKLDFDILMYSKEFGSYSAKRISQMLFKDESLISDRFKNLVNEGYFIDGKISEKAQIELDNHKIDNAVILAAGMSTRFVPLNYEIPKGLLKVKGESLIERQIRQLNEKGIKDIYIVVGYMKEKFEFLKEKWGVKLIETDEYDKRNNHSSVYAAKDVLKNSIITSSDLYFTENIFQTYAYDSYYTTVYCNGKTAERGIETDADDKIINTMYGDKCCDIWVTLGHAYFSESFSKTMISYIEKEYDLPETINKFWADIQDEHLADLYMYAKYTDSSVINEFDSLEELREFDDTYLYCSGSKILKNICYRLAAGENNIIELESLKKIKKSLFKFRCRGDVYICDVEPDEVDSITYLGRVYNLCHDKESSDNFKLYKMDRLVRVGDVKQSSVDYALEQLFKLSKDFTRYHERAVPLCAAENICSEFTNLPLTLGFQERYIMNNTYSFNMEDNFIGCEKLFPFYQELSEVCERIFGARYTDARPFTGMHCIDMLTKTICKPGQKMMILGKEYGGHASVQPVVERLGIKVYEAPYDIDNFDLDYDAVNKMIKDEKIDYVLLAPSDIIKPLKVTNIDTTNCILMWDCSQLMGLIAAGLCENPLLTMKNIIMFGGTHKTFPGPASGLIMTNEKYLHDMMETEINPKYLRHSQMHQKISLLFAFIEFEKFGKDYMTKMVNLSNRLAKELKNLGFDICEIDGSYSFTHQVFLRCSKEIMNLIYDNAYKCEVTLNKKSKKLFNGYGIRFGTQEIARYDWPEESMIIVAQIIKELTAENVDIFKVRQLISKLPEKKISYCFDKYTIQKFNELIKY